MEIPGEGHDGLPEARHVWEARKRIAPIFSGPPSSFHSTSRNFSARKSYLKLENLQEIGAFKIRGGCKQDTEPLVR
jgi:threonine dehydratase